MWQAAACGRARIVRCLAFTLTSSLYTITPDASTRLLHRHQPGWLYRRTGGRDRLALHGPGLRLHQFYASVDAVVMGRKTYDLCLKFHEYPYPGIPNYVWSRTRRGRDEHAIFVSGDIADFLKGLKQKEGNTIWLVGGSALVGEAIRHDLLDELIVSVHPIVLGDGVPLFPRGLPKTQFQFVKSEPFTSGLVQLTYRRTG